MSRLRNLTSRRSIKWPGLALLAGIGLLLLIVLAPLPTLAAAMLVLVAWRAPERISPYLAHRWLDRVPAWLRAAPLRFTVMLFALTLPLTATSWAIGGGAEGAGPSDVAAASEASPAADPVASPTVTPTPRPTAAPRATPTATARPTPTVAPTREPTVTVGGDVSVHFLDVGQGDATLVMAPDATLLIDTGRHDRSDVVPLLRSLGVTTLDVVAITHAHADHIGQLDRVLDGFEVGEVWMSGTPHTTQTFDRAITALEGSSARYEEPRAGDTTTVGSLTVEILNPVGLTGDLHGDGLAVRVTYGSVSFLFTGDIDAAGESAIIARRGALATTVYQVGHHGSSTSTSPGFLAAVQPDVAIYSASATNQYGHPHAEVIQRLMSAGIEVYGTATHGSLTVTTDGSTYRVTTGQTASPLAPAARAQPVPPPPAVPSPVPPAPPPASGCQPGQVDINSAGLDELQLIIHIGPDRAQQILGLRPFSSVDAMTRISGIAAGRLADIKAQGVACAP